mmetsp:Transcript_15040/g.29565  ORF Transcript_15040/g.29565 Transcript_15040/m.29565 type:complete len:317 (+) Transcript_15040:1071-2021(+)
MAFSAFSNSSDGWPTNSLCRYSLRNCTVEGRGGAGMESCNVAPPVAAGVPSSLPVAAAGCAGCTACWSSGDALARAALNSSYVALSASKTSCAHASGFLPWHFSWRSTPARTSALTASRPLIWMAATMAVVPSKSKLASALCSSSTCTTWPKPFSQAMKRGVLPPTCSSTSALFFSSSSTTSTCAASLATISVVVPVSSACMDMFRRRTCKFRYSATCAWFSSNAQSMAVKSSRVVKISAPLSTSNLQHCKWPKRAANISAVIPSVVGESTLQPDCNSSSTIEVLPIWHAMWRGMAPTSVSEFRSAFRSMRSLAIL